MNYNFESIMWHICYPKLLICITVTEGDQGYCLYKYFSNSSVEKMLYSLIGIVAVPPEMILKQTINKQI